MQKFYQQASIIMTAILNCKGWLYYDDGKKSPKLAVDMVHDVGI
jgi:hypothetical protein